MTKEQLQKAIELNKLGNSTKDEIAFWEQCEGYRKPGMPSGRCIEIGIPFHMVDPSPFLPFHQLRTLALDYYRRELQRLEKEIEEL